VASACSTGEDVRADSIDIVGFGILGFDEARFEPDAPSSVGARIGRARALRIVRQTDRIPCRPGLSYGIAFVARGTPPGGVGDLKVILRSSTPCVLKTTGEVGYPNDPARKLAEKTFQLFRE